MSRFHFITLVAVPVFCAIGYFLCGWPRVCVFCGFWAVYLAILGCGIGLIQLQFFGPVVCRGPAGGMRVALTFDDGPDPLVTPVLLDLLKKRNICATFFCIGRQVAAHPELAARIGREGHLLANHTYSHRWWTPLLGARGLMDELARTQQQMQSAAGVVPVYMRPPVGLTNPHYARVLRRLGLKMVGWDVRSMDTSWPIDDVVARVLKRTADGSIILLHDGRSTPKRIEQIVGQIVDGLRAKGLNFARLDRLIEEAPDVHPGLRARYG